MDIILLDVLSIFRVFRPHETPVLLKYRKNTLFFIIISNAEIFIHRESQKENVTVLPLSSEWGHLSGSTIIPSADQSISNGASNLLNYLHKRYAIFSPEIKYL